MKKFAVALIAILVVMGLTVMAQAEVRCDSVYRTEYERLVDGELVPGEGYLADFTNTRTGVQTRVSIDKETYEKFLAEKEAEEEHHNNLWYVKAGKWTSQAAKDVADWVTFWN